MKIIILSFFLSSCVLKHHLDNLENQIMDIEDDLDNLRQCGCLAKERKKLKKKRMEQLYKKDVERKHKRRKELEGLR